MMSEKLFSPKKYLKYLQFKFRFYRITAQKFLVHTFFLKWALISDESVQILLPL